MGAKLKHLKMKKLILLISVLFFLSSCDEDIVSYGKVSKVVKTGKYNIATVKLFDIDGFNRHSWITTVRIKCHDTIKVGDIMPLYEFERNKQLKYY